jgi:hypothetical protein
MNVYLWRYALTLACLLCGAALSAEPVGAAQMPRAVHTVQYRNDSVCLAGDCTLREAVRADNLDGQDSSIPVKKPGPVSNVLAVASRLPAPEENGAAIDGGTEPGYGLESVVVLAVVGGICGVVFGRWLGRQAILWAAAGILLGAGSGAFMEVVSILLLRPPLPASG